MAKRADNLASVGSEAAPRSGFFGTKVTGGECKISDQGTPGSRNLRKVLSDPSTLCAKHRLRKTPNIRRRREIRAASSLAFEAFPPTMAYDDNEFFGGRGGTMKHG